MPPFQALPRRFQREDKISECWYKCLVMTHLLCHGKCFFLQDCLGFVFLEVVNNHGAGSSLFGTCCCIASVFLWGSEISACAANSLLCVALYSGF